MKTCGIMQPYFLPYIGYFQLINKCDNWVIFNNTQFIDKGWVNRNRITNVNSTENPLWFTVPIKKSHKAIINKIEIASEFAWKQKLAAQFQTLRKRSKHFDEASFILHEILALETASLSQLVVHSLHVLMGALQLKAQVFVQDSDFPDIHPGLNLGAGGWALTISQRVGANAYVNPVGGGHLFDHRAYNDGGVSLNYFESELPSELTDCLYSHYSILEIIARHGLAATKEFVKLGRVYRAHD